MKIAVLGAGAMGRLFAAGLSRRHDVLLMDRNMEKVRTLEREGIALVEQDGAREVFRPRVAVMGSRQQPADVAVVFVKAMGTRAALDGCRSLIGPETLLLTLQNGGGHEETLAEFAPLSRVLIGTTQ
ncbi:MAG: 2-dehydropantoate 2-reductase, partial [Clostridia bacterium]|nr:2-dehydropantoate 2-reductase [Clostridia bacterium]